MMKSWFDNNLFGVSKGIYLLELPTPFLVGTVNVYLFAGEPLTLLDTGPKSDQAWGALVRLLGQLGYAVSDIQQVLITHGHVDHFGLAMRIRSESGCLIRTPVLEIDNVVRRMSDIAESNIYGQFFADCGIPDDLVEHQAKLYRYFERFFDPIDEHEQFHGGERFKLGDIELTAMSAPGHSRGHAVFYQAQTGMLFSGDSLIKHISPNPIVELIDGRRTERFKSLPAYLETLNRLYDMELGLILPGHGLFIDDHRKHIKKALKLHQRRKKKLLSMLNAKPRKVYDLAVKMFPSLPASEIFLAISEVIGHLDLLAVEGKAIFDDANMIAIKNDPAND